MPLHLPPVPCIVLVAALWSCSAGAAEPQDLDPDQEIVLRCYYHMGEFGEAGVRACVEGEFAAMRALADYPEEAKGIVSRCTRQFERSGWGIVKLCADKDIAAEADLMQYSEKHSAAIEQCRTQAGRQGSAMVKACADREIEAAGAPNGD